MEIFDITLKQLLLCRLIFTYILSNLLEQFQKTVKWTLIQRLTNQ